MTTITKLKAALSALYSFPPDMRNDVRSRATLGLAAVIAEMEAQQPVAWLRNDEFKAMTSDEKEGWAQSTHSDVSEPYTIPLYKYAQPKAELNEYKGWYCAHCQHGVDGSDVTFREQHTVCGRVITDDVPPVVQPKAEP